jgi:CRISPR-associated endoribonuclease Cas6
MLAQIQPFTLTIAVHPQPDTTPTPPPKALWERLGSVGQHLFLAAMQHLNPEVSKYWHDNADISHASTGSIQRPYVLRMPTLQPLAPSHAHPEKQAPIYHITLQGHVLGDNACLALQQAMAGESSVKVVLPDPIPLTLWESYAITGFWLEASALEEGTLQEDTPMPLAVRNLKQCTQLAFQRTLQEARVVKIYFETPVAFKRKRSTTLHPYPELDLIFQSALRRWNALMPEEAFCPDEPESLVQTLVQHCEVQDMQLKLQTYFIGKAPIRGSIGTIRIKLPQAHQGHLLPIAHTLLASACYTHIGTKTQMGFGGIRLEVLPKK